MGVSWGQASREGGRETNKKYRMASHARMNPDYIPKEQLERATRKKARSPQPPEHAHQDLRPERRVFSSNNLRDYEMGVEERSRKKKGGKGAKADTFLTPDRWAAGGW